MKKLANGSIVLNPNELEKMISERVSEKMGRKNRITEAAKTIRKRGEVIQMKESVLIDKIEKIVNEVISKL